MELVFFGTGPVAAKSLEFLSDNFKIEAVVTKHKKSRHRNIAPVEEVAKFKGHKVYFASSEEEIRNQFETLDLNSTVGVVIDFGVVIPIEVIDYFRYGIINSHFSLLPRWRGADPITFAILNGDQQTGVSLMQIVERLDEGPLLAQKNLIIDTKDTQITLTEKLIELSNKTLLEYLPKYIAGKISPTPQSLKSISYSKKLAKEDGLISWNNTSVDIERQIRAYAGWPKSRASINNVDCIILEADIDKSDLSPGELSSRNNTLLIGCLDGSLSIKKIQPSGKKPMSAGEFIRGYIKN